MESKIIAIDFNGTCVTHEFPNEDRDVGAVPVLKRLVENGHKLILYTMRSGIYLDTAIQWFIRNDIDLYSIQYDPEQVKWTASNKCYADLYIDDAALGAPLIKPISGERPYIDWKGVEALLEVGGYFDAEDQ